MVWVCTDLLMYSGRCSYVCWLSHMLWTAGAARGSSRGSERKQQGQREEATGAAQGSSRGSERKQQGQHKAATGAARGEAAEQLGSARWSQHRVTVHLFWPGGRMLSGDQLANFVTISLNVHFEDVLDQCLEQRDTP